MQENIKAFIEKAKSTPELMAKLDKLGAKNAGAAEFVSLAAEYGFSFTKEEYEAVKAAGVQPKTGELNEEDLESVAGGWSENRYNPDECHKHKEESYNCKGFMALCWCDHYREEVNGSTREVRKKCVKGCFNYSVWCFRISDCSHTLTHSPISLSGR